MVEGAKDRLKVQAASYRGQDNKGQPCVLTAQSAVQKSAAEPIVDMRQLMAEMRLPNGLAKLQAPRGRINPLTQQVDVAGPLTFDGPNGYRLKSSAAAGVSKHKTKE